MSTNIQKPARHCAWLFALSILLSGCTSTYYNVLDVAGSNVVEKSSCLVYENDTLSVTYNFWQEGGVAAFEIRNKTEKPFYVDWKKCSFVVGGKKFDYWRDEQVAATTSEEYEVSTSAMQTIINYWSRRKSTTTGSSASLSGGSSITTVRKQERVTFIPPRASIYRIGYLLLPNGLAGLISSRVTKKDTIILVGNKNNGTNKKASKSYYQVDYPKESSPFAFRNFITYSFDEGFKSEYYVDNSFYLSKLLQMDEQLFEGPFVEMSGGGLALQYPFEGGKSFFLKVAREASIEGR
jgi:hypothetical protein